MVSISQICGTERNGLSGLEGLLAAMGLEVTTRGIDQDWYKYGEMEGESSVSFSTSWSCLVSSSLICQLFLFFYTVWSLSHILRSLEFRVFDHYSPI